MTSGDRPDEQPGGRPEGPPGGPLGERLVGRLRTALSRTRTASAAACATVSRATGRGARRAFPRWLRRWLGRLAVAFAGAVVGLLLGAHTTRAVGPFDADLSLRPGLHGGSVVHVPPLGSLELHTHDGPLRLEMDLQRLRPTDAQALLRDPDRLQTLGDHSVDDLRGALEWLAVKSALSAVGSAVVLSVLVYRRRWREPFVAFGLGAVMLAVTAGGGYASWRPDALAEPRYTGLLTNAPALVGDARSIVDRFGAYREELSGLVTNVSKLYAATSTLPTYQPDRSTIRVLHISDLHLSPTAYDVVRSVVHQFRVNVVVDTGDLTDFGSEPETKYVAGIHSLGVPYVYIRGNHDSARTAAAVKSQRNAVVLDGGPPKAVKGLTFVGAGDPRFTPDKETRDDTASAEKVQSSGREIRDEVATLAAPPDVALVHDPLSAVPLKDRVPLVLAGHLHHRVADHLGSTLVLVEGSTGGAGLRGLEGEKPTPIECSVLYFDARTHRLQAYDDLTLGGLGQSEATIERHLVTKEHRAGG